MNAIVRITLVALYAILGLAAAGRSVVQITTKFSEAPLAYSISFLSAVLYTVIAFAIWRGRYKLALWGTAVELTGVIVVGTLGYVESSWWPDETVWTGFGSAYGWVPLVLPIAALVLLVVRRRTAAAASSDPASASAAEKN
ncbi:hypothetical protein [Demequina aurantiaca]|uniref:hypothetical protein n=1 Tax=Demequina aurantiaca TaxID=676200 RepID=UPI000A6AB9DD|nr:hypothetical protein [Demequina aurantiaca]